MHSFLWVKYNYLYIIRTTVHIFSCVYQIFILLCIFYFRHRLYTCIRCNCPICTRHLLCLFLSFSILLISYSQSTIETMRNNIFFLCSLSFYSSSSSSLFLTSKYVYIVFFLALLQSILTLPLGMTCTKACFDYIYIHKII